MGARVGRMFLHAFAQQDLAMCLFVTASVGLALHGKSAKKEGALRGERMRRMSFRQESATLFVWNLVLFGEVTISPIAIPRRD